MNYKWMLSVTSLFLCLVSLRGAALSHYQNSCTRILPETVDTMLRDRYPEWKIVKLDDLGVDEQRFWREKRGHQCPGVIAGNFDPTPGLSYAVTLIRQQNGQIYQVLLLVHKVGGNYEILTLSPAEPTAQVSVVVKIPPGQYSGFDDPKKVHAKFGGISYEVIEVGAIMYYWEHNRYRTLQLSE